nr:class I SAM-dependent methyltransferase [Lunatimonas salinarum]
MPGDQVLYCGGGSGLNLPYLLHRVGRFGGVVYVEPSVRMTILAKDRIASGNVDFVDSMAQVPPTRVFDVVMTQYLLDILDDRELDRFFGEVGRRVLPGTRWLVVDFYPKAHKKAVWKTMIQFFRLLVNHPRRDLPAYDTFFERFGWKVQQQVEWQRGFMVAKVFRKEDNLADGG